MGSLRALRELKVVKRCRPCVDGPKWADVMGPFPENRRSSTASS